MAMLWPSAAHRLDLAFRQHLGHHFVDAELARDGLRGAALSPVIIATFRPS
jgi:hypothetical protein